MDMLTISDNDKYVLQVDTKKNRVYLRIIGYWRNVEAVSGYLSDWKKAINLTSRGFTLLTDASEMKTHPSDVKDLHLEAQAMIIKAGILKVAEVLKDDIAEMQLNAVAKQTRFPKKNFYIREEAEQWLDEDLESSHSADRPDVTEMR